MFTLHLPQLHDWLPFCLCHPVLSTPGSMLMVAFVNWSRGKTASSASPTYYATLEFILHTWGHVHDWGLYSHSGCDVIMHKYVHLCILKPIGYYNPLWIHPGWTPLCMHTNHVSNIKDNHDSISTSVIRWSDCSESLLSCSIPLTLCMWTIIMQVNISHQI